MVDLAELLRPELADSKPYLPTLGSFRVRLDANEAPPLFGAGVRERLARAFTEIALERYPDVSAEALKGAIAARLGVDPAQILLGVGSDEIITMLLTALARPRGDGAPITVATTTPTFVMYKLSARLRGQRMLEVPLDAAWDIAEDGLLRALELATPHLLFIASPNNPTGTLAHPERLERVLRAATKTLVVLDEAYVDYADRHRLDLVERFENVAVLRTLSKVGFAALRVGWLVGRPELVRELDKVRLPYNLSTPSQALAAVVLSELWDEVLGVTRAVRTERARLEQALAAFPGVEVTPSQANFLWLKTARPAADVFRELGERGILVRSFHASGGRLANQIRVTLGTPAENDEFVECLRALV